MRVKVWPTYDGEYEDDEMLIVGQELGDRIEEAILEGLKADFGIPRSVPYMIDFDCIELDYIRIDKDEERGGFRDSIIRTYEGEFKLEGFELEIWFRVHYHSYNNIGFSLHNTNLEICHINDVYQIRN